MKMQRVNIDEIDTEYTTSGSPVYTCQGKPFTGIADELNIDGKLINETSYLDGMEDGIEKFWYPNGQSESVSEVKGNRPHGKFQHWYEDGKIKYEGVCELGYVVKRKEWDKNGNLINEYNIENDPERYKQVLREREIFQRYSDPKLDVSTI
jgi:antitoxin component YwqK of YwqJK toxin-antitoxin module